MEVAAKGNVKRRHLNADECSELGRSPDGAGALTRPQTVRRRQSNRDPNLGLQPRTASKKLKLGSPSGKQRDITNFYSVTGVVSSSPQKSAPPCSSTQTHGLPGELAPKEGTNVQEDEDDDDDDVSLLAAQMEMEEDDDVSLLATPIVDEADYFQGITAEMFEDDGVFDHCDGGLTGSWGNACKEAQDEVESLPDAHYGLLGSSRDLQEPQGCIDDLPEEVLRQLLSLLPAKDLYRNASRVCHHWRSIVQDPKFVPLKKQYYRYMSGESATVQEVRSILKTNGILNPTRPQHSVLSLVLVMAQHHLAEWVRPEDVLQCVKKHRLFPQAESCLRLRIPDVQQYVGCGIEGANPYAAMAVILILSECIDDVQALVSLLASCLSHTAITEYLSQMATMLLAMMRNGVQISNRVHYNIFYVLHLMESASSSVGSAQKGQLQVTHEQQQILRHEIQTDHVVKIMAFADGEMARMEDSEG